MQIDNTLLKYLTPNDLKNMGSVKKQCHEELWCLNQLGLKAHEILRQAPAIHPPSIKNPHIPICYLQTQIQADQADNVRLRDLALVDCLQKLKPEALGDQGFAQGKIDGASFYLIRCRVQPMRFKAYDGLLILFKRNVNVLVTATSQELLQSYNARSPLKLNKVRFFVKELIEKGSSSALSATLTSSTLLIRKTYTIVSLWSRPPPPPSTLRRTLSLQPPLEDHAIAYRFIILRIFLLAMAILPIPVRKEPLLAVLALMFFWQVQRSKQALFQLCLKDFLENNQPQEESLKGLVESKKAVIHLLKELPDKGLLKKCDRFGKTVLHFVKNQEARQLLLQNGACPLTHLYLDYPLRCAIQDNDLPLISQYLDFVREIPAQATKQIIKEATTQALALFLEKVPLFDLNANFGRGGTAIEELFQGLITMKIESEQDYQKAIACMEKIEFLIDHRANTDSIREWLRSCRTLRFGGCPSDSSILTLSTSSVLAWHGAHTFEEVLERISKKISSKT